MSRTVPSWWPVAPPPSPGTDFDQLEKKRVGGRESGTGIGRTTGEGEQREKLDYPVSLSEMFVQHAHTKFPECSV